MKIWKDITSFHAIGRCINNEAKSQTDVYDLLQFCTELIYCDFVQVTTHGPEYMAEITKEVRNTLMNSYDVPEDFIRLYSYPEDKIIAKEAKKVSHKIFKHLHNASLDPNDYKAINKDQFPTGYAGKKLAPAIEIIRNILERKDDVSCYKSELQESMKDDKFNFSLYILLKEEAVVERLQESFALKTWTDANVEALVANCKVVINQTLSSEMELLYAPSYLRSQNNRLLLNENLKCINRWTEEFEYGLKEKLPFKISSDLNVPSAVKLFLLSGGISVEKIIEKAIEARNKLKWVRTSLLTRLNAALFTDDENAISNLESEIERCQNDIIYNFQSLGKGFLGKISNAMTVDINGGLALNIQGIKNGAELIRTMASNRDYTLATHIINAMKKHEKVELEDKMLDLYLSCRQNLTS